MKKFSFLLLVMILFLVGCSQESSKEPTSDPKDDEIEYIGYVFDFQGTSIALHAEAAPILEALGEPMDSFEAPSCAFDGMDRVFLYGGFELHTYENEAGIDCVSAIIFLDDTVTTKEGIYVYSNLDEVLAAYGDGYDENFSLYSYELGNSKITFLVENNEVIAIEYIAITV